VRRLYVQLYLAFIGLGLLSVVLAAGLASVFWERPDPGPVEVLTLVSELGAAEVPQLQPALVRARRSHAADLVIWDADGAVLARVGRPVPRGAPGFFRRPGRSGVRVPLAGARTLGAMHETAGRGVRLVWIAVLMGAVAVGCYPLARRITRRLEAVQEGVQRWGAGDLSVRVPVEGRDEVAQVAATFNDAASKVEALFQAQRRVLASASHELRSPLARLRVAVELLSDTGAGDPEWAVGAVRDIEELDATVGDLLDVGRMQALGAVQAAEPVALTALLRDEAERVGAAVHGPEVTVTGDARLLRRAARNLLENAGRHGAPPVRVEVSADGFSVIDHGPGVAAADIDRIFEPFYRPDGHAEGQDGGVGLGLHLVREIARHHGGEVRVTSDAGATFRVTLGVQTADDA